MLKTILLISLAFSLYAQESAPKISEKHQKDWIAQRRALNKAERAITEDCRVGGYIARMDPNTLAFQCIKPAPIKTDNKEQTK